MTLETHRAFSMPTAGIHGNGKTKSFLNEANELHSAWREIPFPTGLRTPGSFSSWVHEFMGSWESVRGVLECDFVYLTLEPVNP